MGLFGGQLHCVYPASSDSGFIGSSGSHPLHPGESAFSRCGGILCEKQPQAEMRTLPACGWSGIWEMERGAFLFDQTGMLLAAAGAQGDVPDREELDCIPDYDSDTWLLTAEVADGKLVTRIGYGEDGELFVDGYALLDKDLRKTGEACSAQERNLRRRSLDISRERMRRDGAYIAAAIQIGMEGSGRPYFLFRRGGSRSMRGSMRRWTGLCGCSFRRMRRRLSSVSGFSEEKQNGCLLR